MSECVRRQGMRGGRSNGGGQWFSPVPYGFHKTV